MRCIKQLGNLTVMLASGVQQMITPQSSWIHRLLLTCGNNTSEGWVPKLHMCVVKFRLSL